MWRSLQLRTPLVKPQLISQRSRYTALDGPVMAEMLSIAEVANMLASRVGQQEG